MKKCNFCGNEIKNAPCPYCGSAQLYLSEISFIYGCFKNDAASIDLWITENYLIIHKITKGEQFNRNLSGALGGLIGFGIGQIVQSAEKGYGFYDFREIQWIQYPYHAFGLKPGSAFRVILQNGKDFILDARKPRHAQKAIQKLSARGIPIDAVNTAFAETLCQNPAENADTLGNRLCASARAFVR